MKRTCLTAVVSAIVLMAATTLWASDEQPTMTKKDYIIGPGDVLYISVWKNEDLTTGVTVLPDGKIHFPLIGEVVVGGKTLAKLEKELKEKIGTFVPDPNLSVMVQQTNSMLIYVIGEVNNPGQFAMNTNINVLQALAMAGGFSDFANRKKIKIFRQTKNKNEILTFSYIDIAKEENIEQNIRLKRGDVIVVP